MARDKAIQSLSVDHPPVFRDGRAPVIVPQAGTLLADEIAHAAETIDGHRRHRAVSRSLP